MTTGCFAGRCDWRLPTIEELIGIRDRSTPGCGSGSPCTTIPGETTEAIYWSSSSITGDPAGAWNLRFSDGEVLNGSKANAFPIRAVRGGS